MKKILFWTLFVGVYVYIFYLWLWGVAVASQNMTYFFGLMGVLALTCVYIFRLKPIFIRIFSGILLMIVVFLVLRIFFFTSIPQATMSYEYGVTLGENNQPLLLNIVSHHSHAYSFDFQGKHFILVHDTTPLDDYLTGTDSSPSGLYLFEKKDSSYIFLAHQSIGKTDVMSLQGMRYHHFERKDHDTHDKNLLRFEVDFGVFGGSSGADSEPLYQYTLTWNLHDMDNSWLTERYSVSWRYSPLRVFSWTAPFS